VKGNYKSPTPKGGLNSAFEIIPTWTNENRGLKKKDEKRTQIFSFLNQAKNDFYWLTKSGSGFLIECYREFIGGKVILGKKQNGERGGKGG
jgi:hypothetical protein